MISSFEEKVREYCLNRPLFRPQISLFDIIVTFILIECVTFVIALIFHRILGFNFWRCEIIINILTLLLLAKPICKTAVKIYQHFASESTRRKCHCMPSCSEYALMALDKYCWPIALWKIFRRITYTCELPGYKVDYP